MSLVPPSHREGLRNTADSYEKVSQRIKVRQDSAENWAKNDPVLESGEFGYEVGYPTGKLKIGTGSTRWSELPYLMARGPAGQAGLPGQPGPPGKGIQIKGVADVWPPAGTPEPGDLWILDDPLPPTAPAGSAPGDGYVWSGTRWTPTGPIRGPEGVAGESVSVFNAPVAPSPDRPGDLWIKPISVGVAELYVWNGTDWLELSAANTYQHTVSTTTAPATPSEGDLWFKPLPSGESELYVWNGTDWVKVAGDAAPTLVSATAPPGPQETGTLWVTPATATDPALLAYWTGTDWESLASGGDGTIDTTKFIFGVAPYDPNVQTPFRPSFSSIAEKPQADYPVQSYIERLEAALFSSDIVRRGSNATLWRLTVGDQAAFNGVTNFKRSMIQSATYTLSSGAVVPTVYRTLAPEIQFGDSVNKSNLTVNGNVNITGTLKYGGIVSAGPATRLDPDAPDAGEIETVVYGEQYELPTPTEDGYLRSDADDKNWYFAEPVIISDTEPPAPKAGTAIWIDPNGTPPEQIYSNANPPVAIDPPTVEQANGLSIGMTPDGLIYNPPMFTGAVPVVVNGKTYLMPLMEAPAALPGRGSPMFTFADPPVTQASDGTYIGLSPDGTSYTEPFFVGGIPVVVGGKKYLLPLWEE
jgi:hypothetical protein